MAESDLCIGGFTPLTTIDYPEELSAVVFCQGCPWRCAYCQNHHLLFRCAERRISWEEILAFLRRRQGLLDAVVFSGGEPTAQQGLGAALREVRSLGYKTGLHTAGPYPERLQPLLADLDWVGMDIKAPAPMYEAITGVRGSGERAWESARLLIASGVAHEFRTTVHPDLLPPDQVERLADDLAALGAEEYVIQECATERCLHQGLRRKPHPSYLQALGPRKFDHRFDRFSLRLIEEAIELPEY